LWLVEDRARTAVVSREEVRVETSSNGSGDAAAIAGTAYEGPVVTASVKLAGRSIRLVRPAEPDRLLDAQDVIDWNHRDDYMPYWAYLWPGAFLLAEAVAREPWDEGTPALEIGCGLGLAGLVGVGRGMHVTFSDYDETALDFVARSAQANGFGPTRYATRRLDWRDLPGDRLPVIVGSDVLYERRLVPMVADLLATMLEPGGLGLIAGPYRLASEGFPDAVRDLGLTCESLAVTAESVELGPVRGMLHRVRRP
jgi:predicted nicotinamide N-methyase